MKIFLITTFLILFISCFSMKSFNERYEVAYLKITEKTQNSTPYLEQYQCDASGTKIIPNIYKYKGEYEDFISDTDFIKSENLEKLSKKYTKSNWRKDNEFKLLMPNEIKDFHGPLNYIYFSEIINDTLKAQILGNPNGKYRMTTGENYIIVFENNKIKSFKTWNNHYE